MPRHISTSQARAQLADVLERAAYGGERFAIERRGKILGAVVSAADLEVLERLRELEDAEDRAAVARARKDRASIAWDRIKRDLGLD